MICKINGGWSGYGASGCHLLFGQEGDHFSRFKVFNDFMMDLASQIGPGQEVPIPNKDQRRDLKKSYQENGWLTRDEISLAVKAYRLMKSGDDLDDLYDMYSLLRKAKGPTANAS